jgi:hypothetical protein
VEVCPARISLDLIGVPSGLRFSSWTMSTALVRWFFGALAQRDFVSVYYNKLYSIELCLASMREGRGRRFAFVQVFYP